MHRKINKVIFAYRAKRYTSGSMFDSQQTDFDIVVDASAMCAFKLCTKYHMQATINKSITDEKRTTEERERAKECERGADRKERWWSVGKNRNQNNMYTYYTDNSQANTLKQKEATGTYTAKMDIFYWERTPNKRTKKKCVYLYVLCNHCHFAMNSVTNRENEVQTLTKHNNNHNHIKNIKGEKQRKKKRFSFYMVLVRPYLALFHSLSISIYTLYWISCHTQFHISFECLFLKKKHTQMRSPQQYSHKHRIRPAQNWHGLLLWYLLFWYLFLSFWNKRPIHLLVVA